MASSWGAAWRPAARCSRDPRQLKNPNLAEVSALSFYALQVYPGDLGTKGGLVAAADARVLRADGSVIDGLYACGNVSAAVMGSSYAGSGATLGSAMIFGWVSADAIASTTTQARSHAEAA
jgi:3-oxosteroid 1-dehydrogenase